MNFGQSPDNNCPIRRCLQRYKEQSRQKINKLHQHWGPDKKQPFLFIICCQLLRTKGANNDTIVLNRNLFNRIHYSKLLHDTMAHWHTYWWGHFLKYCSMLNLNASLQSKSFVDVWRAVGIGLRVPKRHLLFWDPFYIL